MSMRKQFEKNVWSSWMVYLLRAIIAALFIPYITTVLGGERYGVWVIVFQTVNYFVLLDFGLEKALLRFISRYLSKNDNQQINQILNTSFIIYLFVGTAIIAATWLTSTFLFKHLGINSPVLIQEGSEALKIIGLYMGIRFYLLPFAGSLGGFQRFDIANKIQMVEDIVRFGLLVWLLKSGYGLPELAMAILGLSLLSQIASVILLKMIFPTIRFNLKVANKKTALEMVRFSRVMFGISACWLAIYNMDSILLGFLSSAVAAGLYAPGAQLMLYMRHIVNAVANPLTTLVSQFEGDGDHERIRKAYLRGIRYTSYLSFGASIVAILYARPLIALWLAPEFSETAEVIRILAVSSAFFIPQIIGDAVLIGISQHKYLFRVLLIETFCKICLAFYLVPEYGIVGMALASAIPQGILYITIYPIWIGRALSLSVPLILMTTLRSGFLAMFVTIPVALIIRYTISPDSWVGLSGNVAFILISFIIAGYFVLEESDKKRVMAFFRR